MLSVLADINPVPDCVVSAAAVTSVAAVAAGKTDPPFW